MMKKEYDYLIVGSGLFGAMFAYLANKDGKKCLVIDRRPNFGGNVFCEKTNDIIVHKYGCHVFHTNDRNVWELVNKFTEFDPFVLSPIANYNGMIFNLPFNMNTFTQMWACVNSPDDAKKIIESQSGKVANPKNLEQQAINLVGKDIFEKLIKGYTEKQWGRPCSELPASIIKRLPVRFTFNNNYFDDIYQGVPRFGYNDLINGILQGIEKRGETDFLENKEYFLSIADKVLYTGSIDELFDYSLGELEYRSVRFEEEEINTNNYQGCPVINFTSADIPYTRIIEHKHFDRWCKNTTTTIISREYSEKWKKGIEPYYPIGNKKNIELHKEYLALSKSMYGDKLIYGGRLGDYKYYDMDDAILAAGELYNKIP